MPAPSKTTPDLALKVMPPRMARHALARARLSVQGLGLRSRRLVLVQAPPGFGKTCLLAQWRQELLAEGVAAAWLTCQPQDDASRLAQGLLLATRTIAAHPLEREDAAAMPSHRLEAMTQWLADVAHSALDVSLAIDDVDRLPQESLEALCYAIRNAPANLQFLVGTRGAPALGLTDVLDDGTALCVGAAALRLRGPETLALLRQRLGGTVSPESAVRVHEAVEGWPLGVELMASALEPDRAGLPPALDLHGGALHEHFTALVLGGLAPAEVALLERVCILDAVHPGLAVSLTGDPGADARLAQLATRTPAFDAVEGSDFLRMHGLVRQAMRRRFDAWPAAQRARLHALAARWLGERGMVHSAVRHALAADDREMALSLAERSLYPAPSSFLWPGEVPDWLHEFTSAELSTRPGLLRVAAWARAVGEGPHEALPLLHALRGFPDLPPTWRWQCDLIEGTVAAFRDDPDSFLALEGQWSEPPEPRDRDLQRMRANRIVWRSMYAGNAQLARMQRRHVAGDLEPGDGQDAWGQCVLAMTLVQAGQMHRAGDRLRPFLANAEPRLGRRHMACTTAAALLAAVAWNTGHADEAEAALADRLDVLERRCLPDAAQIGLRIAARLAAAQGDALRAFDLLADLDAVGQLRGLPRMRLLSSVDQIRLYAAAGHATRCESLLAEMEEIARPELERRGPVWCRQVQVTLATARAIAALAGADWARAEAAAAAGIRLTGESRYGWRRLELGLAQAFARHALGAQDAQAQASEILGMARTQGLMRLAHDLHPALQAWAQALQPQAPGQPGPPVEKPELATRVKPTMALTPKERDVLELLAHNLTNKEIAARLDVGSETVKRHLKNLFTKLDAGHRKHLVARARLLGQFT